MTGAGRNEHFLRRIREQRARRRRRRWVGLGLVIAGLGYVRYDFIGQFEQLERDVENIVARCGLPPFYCGEIKTVPPTHSSQSDQIRRYYTPQLIERVGRVYADDVRLLGYTWPDKTDDLARAALPSESAHF